MASLSSHASNTVVKLLNIGESGGGKTGALASLAEAGYRLWVLDYDNGLDILANALRHNPEALARVEYETLRDTIHSVRGVPKIKSPVHAYKDAGLTLEKWKAEEFTASDIIVIDTLTSFSAAAFNEALALAGRLNQRPQLTDYGWMADSVLTFIDMITGPDFHCNVVVNTHIRYLSSEGDAELMRGLPNAKGQEVTRNISKYFNTITLTRTQGTGPAAKRIISTQPQGVIEVKTSNPKGVKSTYPIESGLADLFRDILGSGPPPSKDRASAAPSTTAQSTATEEA